MTSSATPDDATSGGEPDLSWRTSTALDEFTPIYLALARATKTHGAMSPHEVDLLDITVVAQLLGVTGDSYDATAAELASMREALERGESVTWAG